MKKKRHVQNTYYYLPEGLHSEPSFFSDKECFFYRIKNSQIIFSEKKVGLKIIYAPPPFHFFVLDYALNNKDVFYKIISHKSKIPMNIDILWLKLRLKNERRLMGSDVPSPIMTKNLRKSVRIADYFGLNIKDWLFYSNKIQHNIKALTPNILWLVK